MMRCKEIRVIFVVLEGAHARATPIRAHCVRRDPGMLWCWRVVRDCRCGVGGVNGSQGRSPPNVVGLEGDSV